MIHFVLDGYRFKTAGGDDPCSAPRLKELQRNVRGPVDVAGVVRHTHASFTHGGRAAAGGDLRVDHEQQAVVVFFAVPVFGIVYEFIKEFLEKRKEETYESD